MEGPLYRLLILSWSVNKHGCHRQFLFLIGWLLKNLFLCLKVPTISKFYERAIFDQLMEFLNNHFNPLLSAFRSGIGCQTALLRIIEDWKKALDDNKFIAAILMDLSKAFDCLPHNLLMLKLEAYGLSENSLKLFKKLFRKQTTTH